MTPTPQEAMRQEFEAWARSESMPLVSMWISVGGNGQVTSDVQTHDNSYADVSRGLAIIKGEIERVFVEQKNCPHYPANSEQAKRPIVRSPAALRAQPEAVQDKWLEKAMALAHLYANFAKMKRDPASVEEAAEALRTHLSARLLPPQGCQMVPVEPTPEMIAAAAATPGMQAIDSASAIHQLRGNPLPISAFSNGSPLEQAYRAMLAAAPSKEK